MTNTTSTIPGATYARDLPKLEPWLNVVRALRAEAMRGRNTHAIIKVSILVDCDGAPVVWSKPDTTHLEPRSNGGTLCALIEALGE